VRLLFIEDEPESVEPVLRRLRRSRPPHELKVIGFQEPEVAIDDFGPDIVVLDLLEIAATGERQPVGLTQYDIVWDKLFCPLVLYSAQPEIVTDHHEPHPFVKSVRKGRDSIDALLNTIRDLKPHVEALRGAKLHVRHQFARALRDVAPYAFERLTSREETDRAIVRSGRRRLAALMDSESEPGQKLAPWEHYLCPPLNDDIQLGDILFRVGGSRDDPTSFRVVLTPSCDLVASGGRIPKVSAVLAARCCSIGKGIELTSLGGVSTKKLKDRLPSTVLSQGYFEAILPLPSLSGRLPCMAANMRDLELIPLGRIGSEADEFERVASMDSPFRELVAWSYMQIAGRPGLPDRDFNSWAEEILAACQKEREEN
jgi:hypothetical protein